MQSVVERNESIWPDRVSNPGPLTYESVVLTTVGWSGGAMVLGLLSVPGRPTIWMIVGQGPIVPGVGAVGFFFGLFYSLISFLSSFSLSGRWPDIQSQSAAKPKTTNHTDCASRPGW